MDEYGFDPASESEVELFSASETDTEFMDSLVSISKEDLKNCVNILSTNHWQNPRKLPPGHIVLQKYKMLVSSFNLLDERGKAFVKSVISKQYVPSKLIPGTVGAFLFGCLKSDYGDVEKNCSPLCKGGIDSEPCSNQIWVQQSKSPHRFVKANDPDSEIALIYVGSEFNGFTPQEKSDFENGGALKGVVISTKNGKHSIVTPSKPIDDLPLMKGNIRTKSSGDKARSKNKENQNYTMIAAVMIVFAAIVLVAISLSGRSGERS